MSHNTFLESSFPEIRPRMTVSTENATPPRSTNRETRILRYLAVQIQIEIWLSFEFTPRNWSFSIWWILREQHFQWNLLYRTKNLLGKTAGVEPGNQESPGG